MNRPVCAWCEINKTVSAVAQSRPATFAVQAHAGVLNSCGMHLATTVRWVTGSAPGPMKTLVERLVVDGGAA